MSELRRNRAGTIYQAKEDGTLLYQCQYCDTWFTPRSKFKQKFCSESCRVMACRERKHGLAGAYSLKRESTSNADLLRQLKQIKADSREILKRDANEAFEGVLSRQHKTDLLMVQEIRELRSEIRKSMDWLMLIAAIAPVVSPAVVSWFKEVALGEKPPIDQIKDQLAEIKDTLDEKTKADLRKMMEEKDMKDIADSML